MKKDSIETIKSINGIIVNGYEIAFNQSIPLPKNMNEEKFIDLLWEVIKC